MLLGEKRFLQRSLCLTFPGGDTTLSVSIIVRFPPVKMDLGDAQENPGMDIANFLAESFPSVPEVAERSRDVDLVCLAGLVIWSISSISSVWCGGT